MIFTRSFLGVYLYGYRIGELLVLLGLIATFYLMIFFKKINSNSLFNILNYCIIGIVASFLIVTIITKTGLTNTYTFKSSSYIWTIGFLIIGMFSANFLETFGKKLILLGTFIPMIIYIFNTGNYPDFLINIFKEFSDKFQFIKASDVFLCIISIYFYLEKFKIDQRLKLFYLCIYVPLFLPMLIIQSRGSYVGIIIFLLLVFYFERNYIIKNKKRLLGYFLISVIIFIFSTFRVSGVSFNSDVTAEVVTEQVKTISEVKDTKKAFLTFYVSDGRLFSKDETTNWRLDIWQDVASDMYNDGILFYGYGYKSIIPQMVDPSAPGRLGRDGLNENVHNYFVTILSRGGLIQLFIFIFFHFTLINIWKTNEKNNKIFIYYLPVMFVSLLDISMDGVQFPLIFYSSLGYFLTSLNNKKNLDYI